VGGRSSCRRLNSGEKKRRRKENGLLPVGQRRGGGDSRLYSLCRFCWEKGEKGKRGSNHRLLPKNMGKKKKTSPTKSTFSGKEGGKKGEEKKPFAAGVIMVVG